MEGFAALVLVQFCFGMLPLLVHLTTDPAGGLRPRGIAVWRMTAGALVLGSLAVLRHRRRILVAPGDLPRFFACSCLGIVTNQVLALEGVSRTSATQAGLLMTLIPVFTYALAVVVRQEPFRGRRAAGIAIALAGAALLVPMHVGAGRVEAGRNEGSTLGNLLIVANCVSYSCYLVLVWRLLLRYPPLVAIAWLFALSLWTAPLLAWGQPLAPAALTPTARLGLAGVILLPTILAYLLNTFALARLSASTTAVFIYLQPLFAGGSGAWVLGERPGAGAFLAAALLFAGLWLVIRSGGER